MRSRPPRFFSSHPHALSQVGHWHQYTRYPPIDSRNGKVVADYASMSADNATYTNPK